jgi:hypothetical protein
LYYEFGYILDIRAIIKIKEMRWAKIHSENRAQYFIGLVVFGETGMKLASG